MVKPPMRRRDVRLALVALAVLILDQLTKLIARNTLTSGKPLALAAPFLSLTLTTNTGAGFGILQGLNTFLIVVSIAIIVFLGWYYHAKNDEERLPRVPVALIMGGAMSNLVDRIAFGAVTDFIDFSFWPVFNGADAAITVGVALLLLFHLRRAS